MPFIDRDPYGNFSVSGGTFWFAWTLSFHVLFSPWCESVAELENENHYRQTTDGRVSVRHVKVGPI